MPRTIFQLSIQNDQAFCWKGKQSGELILLFLRKSSMKCVWKQREWDSYLLWNREKITVTLPTNVLCKLHWVMRKKFLCVNESTSMWDSNYDRKRVLPRYMITTLNSIYLPRYLFVKDTLSLYVYKRERERENASECNTHVCVCVCVCQWRIHACKRARKGEREGELYIEKRKRVLDREIEWAISDLSFRGKHKSLIF